MKRALFNSLALACLVTGLSAQEAKEQKLKARDVPPAVVAAAAKAYPGARINQWAKETENGKTLYEASMVEGAKKRDVIFTADGTVDVVEEVIAIGELPTPVKDAVKAKYPKTTIHLAERLTRGAEIQYEVALKNAPKKEMVIAADGKIVKEE